MNAKREHTDGTQMCRYSRIIQEVHHKKNNDGTNTQRMTFNVLGASSGSGIAYFDNATYTSYVAPTCKKCGKELIHE